MWFSSLANLGTNPLPDPKLSPCATVQVFEDRSAAATTTVEKDAGPSLPRGEVGFCGSEVWVSW